MPEVVLVGEAVADEQDPQTGPVTLRLTEVAAHRERNGFGASPARTSAAYRVTPSTSASDTTLKEPESGDGCRPAVDHRLWIFAAILVAAGCSGKAHVATSPHAPSSNPYVASLAYAKCLRARGVPHPNPDKHGDFSLTPAQERRFRSVPAKQRDSAMKACFHNLAGLNNQPLSERAHRRAIKVLLQLKRCLHGFGIKVGKPIVQNMSFGRAKFGFEGSGSRPANQTRAETTRVDHLCERRVDMARKISRIIAEDRRTAHVGGF